MAARKSAVPTSLVGGGDRIKPTPDPLVTVEVPTFLELTLSGKPSIKGRPKFFRRGSFVGTYTPKKTRKWETFVADAAASAMEQIGMQPFRGPVTVLLDFFIPICDKRLHGTRHFKRPDLDNFTKAVLDGLSGVVFLDDGQVSSMVLTKVWAPKENAGVNVTVFTDQSPRRSFNV